MFILEYLESIKEALIKLKWCNIRNNIFTKWKWKLFSLIQLFATPGTLYNPWNSPGQNTGVGSCSLLQGIFPIQGSNPGIPHCRQILYQLEPPGKPKNTGVGSLSLLQWSSHPGIEPALQADWFINMMHVKMCAFWYYWKIANIPIHIPISKELTYYCQHLARPIWSPWDLSF